MRRSQLDIAGFEDGGSEDEEVKMEDPSQECRQLLSGLENPLDCLRASRRNSLANILTLAP